jgi:hypothetical protein
MYLGEWSVLYLCLCALCACACACVCMCVCVCVCVFVCGVRVCVSHGRGVRELTRGLRPALTAVHPQSLQVRRMGVRRYEMRGGVS